MSVYTSEVSPKDCRFQKDMFSGSVWIQQTFSIAGTNVISISSPEAAHALRAVVNGAVDLYLRNDLKKGNT